MCSCVLFFVVAVLLVLNLYRPFANTDSFRPPCGAEMMRPHLGVTPHQSPVFGVGLVYIHRMPQQRYGQRWVGIVLVLFNLHTVYEYDVLVELFCT